MPVNIVFEFQRLTCANLYLGEESPSHLKFVHEDHQQPVLQVHQGQHSNGTSPTANYKQIIPSARQTYKTFQLA